MASVYAVDLTRPYLKQALASGNEEAVSKFIAYPIPVSLQGKKRKITSREEFEAHCAEIVTDNVAKAVQISSMKIYPLTIKVS
jgi:hypothetical protein